MGLLKEVNTANGAPHVGFDPYGLGASPPGCAQSEHDVYPPAVGEWYEDLVKQTIRGPECNDEQGCGT